MQNMQNMPNMQNMSNMQNNLLDNIENLSLDGIELNKLSNDNNFKMKDKISENDTLIKKFTNKIINDLEGNESNELNNSKSKKKSKSIIKDTIEKFAEVDNNEEESYYSMIMNNINIKDFIIIFVLYFILSQEMIKDFFSNYFTSLNPDDEGKINVQGVIIYGLILAILFVIIQRLV